MKWEGTGTSESQTQAESWNQNGKPEAKLQFIYSFREIVVQI